MTDCVPLRFLLAMVALASVAAPAAVAGESAPTAPIDGSPDATHSAPPASTSGSDPCLQFPTHGATSLDFDTFPAGLPTETRVALQGAMKGARKGAMRIGEVRIIQQPIFDTSLQAEDKRLYRWANRFHVDTRPEAVRATLLFRPGDPITLEELEESERLLRERAYLYDARVLPRRLCGDSLDVDVVTRDVWTLLPRLQFDRAGGDNEYGIGLSDINVLGSGKNVSVGYNKDRDRSGVDFLYEDPNVRGSRTTLAVFLEDNDDGSRQLLDVRRPFYSMDARHALGLRVDDFDREEGLYLFGDETSEFRHETFFSEASAGWSRGRVDHRANRWLVGYTYEDHSFEPIPGIVAPSPFPEDRRYAYPWVGFESVEERFETMHNFDRFQRVEDLNLGLRWNARLGWSDEAFGADDTSRLAWRSGLANATRLGDGRLLRYGLNINGFWNLDEDEEEDLVTNAFVRYNSARSDKRAFMASLGLTYVRNLPEDRQLLIGGDSGLRGYPSRYQTGDQRFVVNLEERFFTDFYPFRLARVGYVLFADIGRAWASDTPSDDEFGVLANVGIGLRLESTRTRRDKILHLDLAFPLVDGPNVGTVELTFRVRGSL